MNYREMANDVLETLDAIGIDKFSSGDRPFDGWQGRNAIGFNFRAGRATC